MWEIYFSKSCEGILFGFCSQLPSIDTLL